MEILSNIWSFIQDQVLGMQWLNGLIGSLLELVNLNLSSTFGGALQFFIYDVVKIFVLLGVLIFAISYIQSYFPPERTKKILGRYRGITANIIAALLGLLHHFVVVHLYHYLLGLRVRGYQLVSHSHS